jgi:choline kinase
MSRHDHATDHIQVRTALLLAAGLGSRLAPLTGAVPKCLVSVSGVPILERLVRALDSHGFERLAIVTGYKGDAIRDYLGESFGGIAIEYIVSPLFETTNNVYSLWLARDLIEEPSCWSRAISSSTMICWRRLVGGSLVHPELRILGRQSVS